MKFIGKLSIIALALYLVLSYVRVHVLPRFYVFDKNYLQEVGQEVLAAHPGANSTVILHAMHERLQQEYPGHINDYEEDKWVFNNAGNAMGSMLVLHASITEYLIFFGTAVGTEGHTGTHWSEDYFLILHGEEWAATAAALEPEIYRAGDSHHLLCGQNKQYRMPENSWALELAQGWIPSMLPFGFLEVVTSTLDVYSFAKTVKISAINMGWNLLHGKF